MTKKDNLTLKEVCELLSKSKKTETRYIKKGRLNPEKVKTIGEPDYQMSFGILLKSCLLPVFF